MDRPTYTFKIGQRVFYYAGGRVRKKTSSFTVVALVRQFGRTILYRIKSRTHEHLAHEDELKLVLARSKQPLSDE